jgi:drug/metabolite transporter (DMT)-like permease
MGVIAASLALTAVIYLPIAAFSLPHEMPSAAALGAVAGLAVVCTALAFVVFFALIGEIGAVRATVITYVNPAVAAILGVLVLGEHLTIGVMLGFGLVLAGSVLATGDTEGDARARLRPRLRASRTTRASTRRRR